MELRAVLDRQVARFLPENLKLLFGLMEPAGVNNVADDHSHDDDQQQQSRQTERIADSHD